MTPCSRMSPAPRPRCFSITSPTGRNCRTQSSFCGFRTTSKTPSSPGKSAKADGVTPSNLAPIEAGGQLLPLLSRAGTVHSRSIEPRGFPMLTVKQVAERLGVSESLVRSWIRDRALPHYRVGAKGRRGKIVVAQEDLDQFLALLRISASNQQRETPTVSTFPVPAKKE